MCQQIVQPDSNVLDPRPDSLGRGRSTRDRRFPRRRIHPDHLEDPAARGSSSSALAIARLPRGRCHALLFAWILKGAPDQPPWSAAVCHHTRSPRLPKQRTPPGFSVSARLAAASIVETASKWPPIECAPFASTPSRVRHQVFLTPVGRPPEQDPSFSSHLHEPSSSGDYPPLAGRGLGPRAAGICSDG
jgi:hypothetical protein